jgi:uncharacterized membrane protein (DUF485 family)
MKRNELYRLIQQKEREFEREKQKRAAYTIIVYTAVLLLISYAQEQLHLSSFLELAGDVIACGILSTIAFIANGIIFHQLFTVSEGEKKHLEYLKKKLEDMEE